MLKKTCSEYNDTGIRMIVQRHDPMIVETQTQCDECNGAGKIIKDKYKKCKG